MHRSSRKIHKATINIRTRDVFLGKVLLTKDTSLLAECITFSSMFLSKFKHRLAYSDQYITLPQKLETLQAYRILHLVYLTFSVLMFNRRISHVAEAKILPFHCTAIFILTLSFVDDD